MLNMKRFYLILLFSLVINYNFANEPKHPHWSGTIDVGINFFDGDLNDTHTLFTDRISHPSLGTSVDYAIFPFLSMGIAYNYHFVQANNGSDFFNSNMHQFYPYLGVNLLNLAFQKNPGNFSLWAHVGFGLAKFNFVNQTLPNLYTDPSYPQNVLLYYMSNTTNGLYSYVVPYGITLEYKLSNQFSLGLQIDRCKYSMDDLEGINKFNWVGGNKDFLNSTMLQVRYKFCNKERKHLRDCSWAEVFNSE